MLQQLLFAAALSNVAANIGFAFLAGVVGHFRVNNHSTSAPLTLFTMYSTPDESILLLT